MKGLSISLVMDQIPKGTAQMKRANFRNGTFFEGKDIKAAREFYLSEIGPEAPETPFNGPISVSVEFYYPIKDKSKKGQFKTSRPDCDNLVKLLLDCMTQLRFWDDDAQIAILKITKKYSVTDEAGIMIYVKELCE